MTDDGEQKDTPIEAMGFVSGVTVIDFGEIRVARGLSKRPYSGCHHRALGYDSQKRRVWCRDCERTIEPFDAFELLVNQYSRAWRELNRRRERTNEAETKGLRSLAARALDAVWRSRKMVPACPMCGHGLFPEDFKNGVKVKLGRDYAEAKRKAKDRP